MLLTFVSRLLGAADHSSTAPSCRTPSTRRRRSAAAPSPCRRDTWVATTASRLRMKMSETISVWDHSQPCEHGSRWPPWINAANARAA